MLRSLSTTDGASDEDDEADATATTGATATGPLCQLDCSEERLRPVCGSDGITYPSRCHLQQAVCQGNDVRLDYRGECSDSEIFFNSFLSCFLMTRLMLGTSQVGKQ